MSGCLGRSLTWLSCFASKTTLAEWLRTCETTRQSAVGSSTKFQPQTVHSTRNWTWTFGMPRTKSRMSFQLSSLPLSLRLSYTLYYWFYLIYANAQLVKDNSESMLVQPSFGARLYYGHPLFCTLVLFGAAKHQVMKDIERAEKRLEEARWCHVDAIDVGVAVMTHDRPWGCWSYEHRLQRWAPPRLNPDQKYQVKLAAKMELFHLRKHMSLEVSF